MSKDSETDDDIVVRGQVVGEAILLACSSPSLMFPGNKVVSTIVSCHDGRHLHYKGFAGPFPSVSQMIALNLRRFRGDFWVHFRCDDQLVVGWEPVDIRYVCQVYYSACFYD